jgi:hypothetical protein
MSWWWLAERSGLRAWLSAFGRGAAALASAYLVWAQLTPQLQRDHPTLGLGAVLVVGGIAVLSALARPVRIHTVDRLDRQREKVAATLRLLPWAVHEQSRDVVPVRPLGASAWVVVTTLRGRRLHRIAKERVNQTPGPSQVRWTKGKGVIGQCWRTGQAQCFDAAAYDALHGGLTEAAWRAADDTMGLSYDDYRQIVGKYGTVIAVPLTDARHRRTIGVVALDAPRGWHVCLTHPRVTELVADAAGTVANLVS